MTLYREALCTLLARIFPNVTVFEESDGDHEFTFNAGPVDLIILCFKAPHKAGLEKLLDLRRRFELTPIILLSDVSDRKVILMARVRGANGIVYASDGPEDLLSAIHEVLAGKMVFPEQGDERDRRISLELSPRQREVFSLLCTGMTNKEIALALRLSNNTVRTHIAAIFDILDVRNRTEAVAMGSDLIQ